MRWIDGSEKDKREREREEERKEENGLAVK